MNFVRVKASVDDGRLALVGVELLLTVISVESHWSQIVGDTELPMISFGACPRPQNFIPVDRQSHSVMY